MIKMLRLKSNIEGERYSELINICVDLSDYFSLTTPYFYTKDKAYKKFLYDLKPYYKQKFLKPHWFCYYVPKSTPLEVSLFSADNDTKCMFMKSFDNLFQRERNIDGTWGNVKNLPVDLCFFIGTVLLLGTVSHENICYVYPPTQDIADQFLKLGNWSAESYFPAEQISLVVD